MLKETHFQNMYRNIYIEMFIPRFEHLFCCFQVLGLTYAIDYEQSEGIWTWPVGTTENPISKMSPFHHFQSDGGQFHMDREMGVLVLCSCTNYSRLLSQISHLTISLKEKVMAVSSLTQNEYCNCYSKSWDVLYWLAALFSKQLIISARYRRG